MHCMSWLIDLTSHEVQLNSLLKNIMDGYPFHILSISRWVFEKILSQKMSRQWTSHQNTANRPSKWQQITYESF